jgi:hypothetical protein
MTPDAQTVVNLLAVLLVVISGVCLFYDRISAFGLNLAIPQAFSLSFVGITALLAGVDALLQGYSRQQDANRATEERNRATEERERASRRARIQNRCLAAQIRYQLDPDSPNRQFLTDLLALLEEYGDLL